MKFDRYEIHTNEGGAGFETEKDALAAFYLLCLARCINIDEKEISGILNRRGYYDEHFPLVIRKLEDVV